MKGIERIDPEDVRGILHLGGSILGSSNRSNPFEYADPGRKGAKARDISNRVLANFKKCRFDALVAIGGDGTLGIAHRLYEKGMPVVGVPKTIDNDVYGTVITFGFDTAVSTATDALDKLHSHAQSHQRVMVVEVMGRDAGWIALHSGIAGSADVILLPEIPFDLDVVCEKVRDRYRRKRNFCIVVAAEGAKTLGGKAVVQGPKEAGRAIRLGGIGEVLAQEIQRRTGRETRSIVLGHLQRGGSPTTFDRLLGTRFGVGAIELVEQGTFDHMIGLKPPDMVAVPLVEVAGRIRTVPVESQIIRTARRIGISFGD